MSGVSSTSKGPAFTEIVGLRILLNLSVGGAITPSEFPLKSEPPKLTSTLTLSLINLNTFLQAFKNGFCLFVILDAEFY